MDILLKAGKVGRAPASDAVSVPCVCGLLSPTVAVVEAPGLRCLYREQSTVVCSRAGCTTSPGSVCGVRTAACAISRAVMASRRRSGGGSGSGSGSGSGAGAASVPTYGRIVRLELENFKTYKGKHTVGPLSTFTCIVGPNGSGTRLTHTHRHSPLRHAGPCTCMVLVCGLPSMRWCLSRVAQGRVCSVALAVPCLTREHPVHGLASRALALAGKSNIMDAISFVLGLQARALRCSTMQDLIFRNEGEVATATKNKRASVRMVYQLGKNDARAAGGDAGSSTASSGGTGMSLGQPGDFVSFSRTISPSGSSSYRVNHKEVTRAEYSTLLAAVGVVARGTNCLVAQGTVKDIGTRTPQAMMELFEQVSGSGALK